MGGLKPISTGRLKQFQIERTMIIISHLVLSKLCILIIMHCKGYVFLLLIPISAKFNKPSFLSDSYLLL